LAVVRAALQRFKGQYRDATSLEPQERNHNIIDIYQASTLQLSNKT
jgi:hypothetical protein